MWNGLGLKGPTFFVRLFQSLFPILKFNNIILLKIKILFSAVVLLVFPYHYYDANFSCKIAWTRATIIRVKENNRQLGSMTFPVEEHPARNMAVPPLPSKLAPASSGSHSLQRTTTRYKQSTTIPLLFLSRRFQYYELGTSSRIHRSLTAG